MSPSPLRFALALALAALGTNLAACAPTTAAPTGAEGATEPDDETPADDDAIPADDTTPAKGKDAGSKSDGGPPSKSDGGSSGKPDGGKPDSGGPVQTGGSITVTCPQAGFHKGPPVTIASVPPPYLPRCTSATRTCYLAAATNAAVDACLAADTTPPAMVDGEPVDCMQCERSQGSYCLASACKSEFAAYACCAQAEQNEAPCQAQMNAMIACAGGKAKAAFEACTGSLVPMCFN